MPSSTHELAGIEKKRYFLFQNAHTNLGRLLSCLFIMAVSLIKEAMSGIILNFLTRPERAIEKCIRKAF